MCALFLTKIVGHSSSDWGRHAADIHTWFGTISNSMRTLFVVITLNEWDTIAFTLSERYNAAIVFFCMFTYITCTAWTMMSLITGIISESLLQTQMLDDSKKLAEIEQAKAEFTKGLADVLSSLDENGDGTLSRQEVEHALTQNGKLIYSLAALEIDMDKDELLYFFDLLNPTSDPTFEISIDVVSEALKSSTGFAKAPAIWDLKHRMRQVRTEFSDVATSLHDSVEMLDDMLTENGKSVENQLDDMLSKLAPGHNVRGSVGRTSL